MKGAEVSFELSIDLSGVDFLLEKPTFSFKYSIGSENRTLSGPW